MILKNFFWAIINAISQFLILCIQFFRPLLGPVDVCPFTIGCTEYAILQLKTQRLHIALYNIVKRILMCSPLRNLIRYGSIHNSKRQSC